MAHRQKLKKKPEARLSLDKDFTGSCCDYKSDIFKEQPSMVEYSYMIDKGDSSNNLGNDENASKIVSPQYNRTPTAQQETTNTSLRINLVNSMNIW